MNNLDRDIEPESVISILKTLKDRVQNETSFYMKESDLFDRLVTAHDFRHVVSISKGFDLLGAVQFTLNDMQEDEHLFYVVLARQGSNILVQRINYYPINYNVAVDEIAEDEEYDAELESD